MFSHRKEIEMEKIFFQKIIDTAFYRFYKYAKEDLQILATFLYDIHPTNAEYWKQWSMEVDPRRMNNEMIFATKEKNKIKIWDRISMEFDAEENNTSYINFADYPYFEISVEDFIHFINQWNQIRESSPPEIRLIRDDTGKIWLEGGQKTPLPESDSVKIHDSWKE